jgi:hypothetical protein
MAMKYKRLIVLIAMLIFVTYSLELREGMYEFPIGKTTLYGNCPEGCKECNVDPKD